MLESLRRTETGSTETVLPQDFEGVKHHAEKSALTFRRSGEGVRYHFDAAPKRYNGITPPRPFDYHGVLTVRGIRRDIAAHPDAARLFAEYVERRFIRVGRTVDARHMRIDRMADQHLDV